jgi:hypothetical protein
MPASEIREFDLTWRWRRTSLETPVGTHPAANADVEEAKTSA